MSPQRTIERVTRLLARHPHLSAGEVSRHCAISLADIGPVYRAIAASPRMQALLAGSPNADYFSTVRRHFGQSLYTVVFFVGNYCPARCHFCPSVEIEADGLRKLHRFSSRTPGGKKMGRETLERIFHDLRRMQRKGTEVEVKISGGLEPFTDLRTLETILDLCARHAIRSTLFTNGMLLLPEKNRRLALKADLLRVSLSTTDEASYRQAYFGTHPGNRPVATLEKVFAGIRALLAARERRAPGMRIGINTVAGDFNRHQLKRLVLDLAALGVDFIDMKGDYFAEEPARLEEALDELRDLLDAEQRVGATRVHLSGSLHRENFYHQRPDAHCNPLDQARKKMFITPFGDCTPLHHWAYPTAPGACAERHLVGPLGAHTGMAEAIMESARLPRLHYRHLNPFETIIALETERRRKDRECGLPPQADPYCGALETGKSARKRSVQGDLHAL